MLVESDIDFLHISCWDCFTPPAHHDDSRMLTEIFAERLANRLPMITCGAVWSTAQAQEVMDQEPIWSPSLVQQLVADWAKYLGDSGYEPQRPPFTAEHLLDEGLSEKFVDYMRAWQGFVV